MAGHWEKRQYGPDVVWVWVEDKPSAAKPAPKRAIQSAAARRAARLAAKRAAEQAAKRAAAIAKKRAAQQAAKTAEQTAETARIAQLKSVQAARHETYEKIRAQQAEILRRSHMIRESRDSGAAVVKPGAKVTPKATGRPAPRRAIGQRTRLQVAQHAAAEDAQSRALAEQYESRARDWKQTAAAERVKRVAVQAYRNTVDNVGTASMKDIESAVKYAEQKAASGQINAEDVQKLTQAYEKQATDVATKFNSVTAKLNAILDKSKKGGLTDAQRARAQKIYAEEYAPLRAEFERLFGADGAGKSGAYLTFYESAQKVNEAQADWWRRQVQASLNATKADINQQLRDMAGAPRHRDGEGGGRRKELLELKKIFDGQTGMVRDGTDERGNPIYRRRTIEEELAHRQAQSIVEQEKIRAAYVRQEATRRREMAQHGLVEGAGGRALTREDHAIETSVLQEIKKMGTSPKFNSNEAIDDMRGRLLTEWDKKYQGPHGSAYYAARKKYRDQINRYFKARDPEWWEVVIGSAPVDTLINGLAFAQGLVGTAGRLVAGTAGVVTGDPNMTTKVFGVEPTSQQAPPAIMKQMDAAEAKARAANGGTGRAADQASIVARNSVYQAWMRTPAGKAWYQDQYKKNKAASSAEDQAFVQALQLGEKTGTKPPKVQAALDAIDKRTDLTASEKTKMQAAYWVQWLKTPEGTAWGKDNQVDLGRFVRAVVNYGSVPTANDGANLLAQLLTDPLIGVPLKFTKYLARANFAQQIAAQGSAGAKLLGSTKLGAARNFLKVDEGYLRMMKQMDDRLTSLGSNLTSQQMVDAVRAIVANATEKTNWDKEVESMLTKLGLKQEEIGKGSLRALVEDMFVQESRVKGIRYKTQADELQEHFDAKYIAEKQARAAQRLAQARRLASKLARRAEVKKKADEARARLTFRRNKDMDDVLRAEADEARVLRTTPSSEPPVRTGVARTWTVPKAVKAQHGIPAADWVPTSGTSFNGTTMWHWTTSANASQIRTTGWNPPASKGGGVGANTGQGVAGDGVYLSLDPGWRYASATDPTSVAPAGQMEPVFFKLPDDAKVLYIDSYARLAEEADRLGVARPHNIETLQAFGRAVKEDGFKGVAYRNTHTFDDVLPPGAGAAEQEAAIEVGYTLTYDQLLMFDPRDLKVLPVKAKWKVPLGATPSGPARTGAPAGQMPWGIDLDDFWRIIQDPASPMHLSGRLRSLTEKFLADLDVSGDNWIEVVEQFVKDADALRATQKNVRFGVADTVHAKDIIGVLFRDVIDRRNGHIIANSFGQGIEYVDSITGEIVHSRWNPPEWDLFESLGFSPKIGVLKDWVDNIEARARKLAYERTTAGPNIGAMDEVQYWDHLEREAHATIKAAGSTAAQRFEARQVLRDIERSRFAKMVDDSGGNYVTAAERQASERAVLATYGGKVEGVVADGMIAPYIEDALAATVERGRNIWRLIRNSTDDLTADDINLAGEVRGAPPRPGARPGYAARGPLGQDIPRTVKRTEDYFPYELWVEVEKKVADAIAGVRGKHATTLTSGRKAQRPVGRTQPRVMILRDSDPRLVAAKRKVLREYGISVRAYDEARAVLRPSHLKDLNARRLMAEAKAAGGDYFETFKKLRHRDATHEGRRWLGQLAAENPDWTPDEVFEDFMRRYGDDGVLRRDLPALSPFQRRTLERHMQDISGINDLTDQDKIAAFLQSRNMPPMSNRAKLREFLIGTGAWSPRTADRIILGAESWSVQKEAKYWMDSYGIVPEWADVHLLTSTFKHIFHNEDAYYSQMRAWGFFDRTAELSMRLKNLTADEMEEMMLHGDESIGLKGRRSVEEQRRYMLERYGPLVADDVTKDVADRRLTAIPWLMNEAEQVEYLVLHHISGVAPGLIKSPKQLAAIVKKIRPLVDRYMDEAVLPEVLRVPDGAVRVQGRVELAKWFKDIPPDFPEDIPIWRVPGTGNDGKTFIEQVSGKRVYGFWDPGVGIVMPEGAHIATAFHEMAHSFFEHPKNNQMRDAVRNHFVNIFPYIGPTDFNIWDDLNRMTNGGLVRGRPFIRLNSAGQRVWSGTNPFRGEGPISSPSLFSWSTNMWEVGPELYGIFRTNREFYNTLRAHSLASAKATSPAILRLTPGPSPFKQVSDAWDYIDSAMETLRSTEHVPTDFIYDRAMTYKSVFKLSNLVVSALLADPTFSRRWRDVFGDVLNMWATLNRALVFTNPAFMTMNVVDTGIKTPWHMLTNRMLYFPDWRGVPQAVARAASQLTLRDIGLDLQTSIYKYANRSVRSYAFDPVNTGLRGAIERATAVPRGLYRMFPYVAGHAEMKAKLMMAQKMYPQAYQAALDKTGDALLADALAKDFLKDEVRRMWPTVGDGPMEKLFNEFVPFASYSIKNKLLFIEEAINNPWLLTKINYIGEFIEKQNLEAWEKEHPGEPMPRQLARQLRLPWAPDITIDLGQFSDATRGLKPLFDSREKTALEFGASWIRLINPSTQALMYQVMNAMNIAPRLMWQPILDEDGFITGYKRVTVGWTEPWSQEQPDFGSWLWAADAFETAALFLPGGLTPAEQTVLVGKMFMFDAMHPLERGAGLFEVYKLMKAKDPAAAEAWLTGSEDGAIVDDWMKSQFTKPQDLVDWLNPALRRERDPNAWFHTQTKEFQSAVRLGYERINRIRDSYKAKMAGMDPLSQAFKDLKAEMNFYISEVYRLTPELRIKEVSTMSATEWAARLQQWQTDQLTDQYFAMLDQRPRREDFKNVKDYNEAVAKWEHNNEVFLQMYPTVREQLAGDRMMIANQRAEIEKEWDDILTRISKRNELIDAAKRMDEDERAGMLQLANELDYRLLEREYVAMSFSDEDFKQLRSGIGLKDGALPAFSTFLDFTAVRRAKAAREGKLDEFLRQQAYGKGMAAIILKAKGGDPFGKFDPAVFVRELKKNPSLMKQYFDKNPGKEKQWADNSAYFKWISTWGKAIGRGDWDAADRAWNALPNWVKERYYATHPGSRARRAASVQTGEYLAWMGRWVKTFDSAEKGAGMKFFWDMPKWVRERYFAKHPDKRVKWEGELRWGAKLAEYFAAAPQEQAAILAANPGMKAWLTKYVSGKERRRQAILAAYSMIPKGETWLKRVYREKYPDIFSAEAKGEARVKKVYDQLAKHPQMLPSFEKWVAAIWASYQEMLQHHGTPPPWLESDHERQNRRARGSLSAEEASR